MLSYDQQSLYFLIYGFLAWVVQVIYWAGKKERFINPGMLTLPIDYEIGLVYFFIVPVLPTMGRNYVLMYVFVLIILIIVESVMGFIGVRITKNAIWMQHTQDGRWQTFRKAAVSALAVLIGYLVVQPFIMNLVDVIPSMLLRVGNMILDIAVIVDFVTVFLSMREGQKAYEEKKGSGDARKISERIYQIVWKRLEKAYPGIHDETEKENIVFAQGLNLDKLIWVFLSVALLGDGIETIYCRIVGGTWMSRSSVIYGPFTFVWGLGAVALTIVLLPLAKKKLGILFVSSALVWGGFEYLCSVLTELVFGTVFWDYKYMGPLSIGGGRTNLLFMFFGGILGVVWIKILYPPLNKYIEKLPVIAAKIATWLIFAFMLFNGLFTMKVMLRFNERQAGIAPSDRLEEYIDETYDDDFVKNRWPNMVVVKK